MTGPTDPVLYSFRRCPYAIRARLALAVSGTRYELREVSLRAKPAAMLAISPKATVPVLVLSGGEVIDESLGIMRWALTKHDPEAWLKHHDAALIAENDGPFKLNLDGYKYPDRHPGDPLVHRDRGLSFLLQLEGRVARNDQLAGPKSGFTDWAIMPFVRQFAAVDPEWFAAQPLPHLRSWLARHVGSDLFHSVMTRVAIWLPDNPATFAGRSKDIAPAEFMQ